jgi:hypothetical protein
VIFTHRLVLTGATRWALVIPLTTSRWTTAAIAFWAFQTLAGWAGLTRRTWGVLTGLVLMRTLVRVNGGGTVFFRMRLLFGWHMSRFLLLASADDAFQAGFESAEKGGFLRGVFGSAWGGHKRFKR